MWSHSCSSGSGAKAKFAPKPSSLLNRLHTLPSTAQSLLPQADPVVACADSEHVSAQTPRNAPGGCFDVEYRRLPVSYLQLASQPCAMTKMYVRRSEEVQIRTVLSCDADAMYDFESTVGDQATSRTQSVCPGRICMLLYEPVSALHSHSLT